MLNQSALNVHALGDSESFPITAVGTEAFGLVAEGIVAGALVAERLGQSQVEGDYAGWGLLGTAPLGEMPANDLQLISGRLWSLFGQLGAAETFTPLASETARVIARVVLNLGSDEPSFVKVGTLRVDWELNRRARLSFGLHYPGDPRSSYAPRAGHQTQIVDFDGTTTIFAGTIFNPQKELLHTADGNKLTMACTAVGWEQIADRFHATKAYTDEDLDVIAGDLVSTYLAADGITATGLPTGITVPGTVTFSYLKVSTCLDQLTKITGYWWRISPEKNLEFYAAGSAVEAPLSISATSDNFIKVTVSEDLSNYRNRQYLVGYEFDADEVVEAHRGNSVTRGWSTAYPLYSAPRVVWRDLNTGTEQEKTVSEIAPGFENADYYWRRGESLVTSEPPFPYDPMDPNSYEPDPAPDSGIEVLIIYTPTAGSIRSVTKTSEVEARQAIEGGSGVYEDVAGDGVVFRTTATADAYAQALIDRTAPVPKVVTILTDHGAGTLPGMVVPIDLPELDLAGNYFVSKASANDFAGGKRLRYTITCSSNEPEESWKAGMTRKGDGVDRTQMPTTNTDV